MRFTLAVLLTLLAGTAIGLLAFVPWWGFVLSTLLVAVILPQTPSMSFAAGFLGMFMAWGGLAWWIDQLNKHILSSQIANIFPLQGSSAALLLITGLLGGLIAGVAAMAGTYLRTSSKKS
ncbi:MAG: hypothetical protein ACO3AY_08250 [Chitinophagaceae bacterium]